MKLEGCIALVTGANRGLGKALVAALLEAGATKIVPDPMAQQMGALWRQDPKAYERAFASF